MEWNALEGQNATRLFTEVIPAYEMAQLTPELKGGYTAPGMQELATVAPVELSLRLRELLQAYRSWIADQRSGALATLPATLKPLAEENLKQM